MERLENDKVLPYGTYIYIPFRTQRSSSARTCSHGPTSVVGLRAVGSAGRPRSGSRVGRRPRRGSAYQPAPTMGHKKDELERLASKITLAQT